MDWVMRLGSGAGWTRRMKAKTSPTAEKRRMVPAMRSSRAVRMLVWAGGGVAAKSRDGWVEGELAGSLAATLSAGVEREGGGWGGGLMG